MGNSRSGFTLLEVLTSVIVVAVVASLAVPSYVKTVDEERDTRATTVLRLIRNAEEDYRTRYDTYTTSWAALEMTQPAVDDFTYQLASADATTFQAQATRVGGSSYAFTIDQTGAISTTDPNHTAGGAAKSTGGTGGGILRQD